MTKDLSVRPHTSPERIENMTASTANSSRVNDVPRCAQRYSNGKRCRSFAGPRSAFCPRHSATDAEDLAAILTGGLEEFTSAAHLNDFLSRLLLLLTEGRISPRRAAVMAYIANLLLRTISAIDQQRAAARDPRNRLPRIFRNIPSLELHSTGTTPQPDDESAPGGSEYAEAVE
jgi:hypothetical protein